MGLRLNNLLALLAGACLIYVATADEGKHAVSLKITDLVSLLSDRKHFC